MMLWQSVVVLVLVLLCAGHVVWRLMLPAAWRQRALARLQAIAWPEPVARRMRRFSTGDAPACGPCSSGPDQT